MTQKISGNLHVSNDVLADLAGTAALGCYGVVGMAAPSLQDGIANSLTFMIPAIQVGLVWATTT